jgi:lipid-A-disaccharide synthase
MRIGIVAGEASGDILGAALMVAIQQRYPECVFEGIGGPRMQAAGCSSFFPMDRLAVMGLVEPLKRLPELLHIRGFLKRHFERKPPDLFIGIDSPDFNLNIERHLHRLGIKTAHYVSPSVWAWRQKRIFKIKESVDLMLTLFPFEAAFYQKHSVPVEFVGHPLADQIPLTNDSTVARNLLGLDAQQQLVALLPGSRATEVSLMGPIVIDTALWCLQHDPSIGFVIPALNSERYQQLTQMLATPAVEYQQANGRPLPITLLTGHSQDAMAAADAVLMASGTTTLEALLLKRPMVVIYKMAPLSALLLRWLVKSKFISLPNLLTGSALVPEVLQENARADVLGPLLMDALKNTHQRELLMTRFDALHRELRRNASERAADALLKLIGR